MSQRTALLLSLALTVLVGVAIVANRDRLIGASPDTPSSGPVTTVSDASSASVTDVAEKTGARVVEITLPASTAAALQAGRTGGSESDARFGDDDHFDDDDHDDHDDDDEHDDHEDDDDD